MPPTEPEDTAHDDTHSGSRRSVVVISVVRTGGIAGLRRTWRAEPDASDAERWISLIEGCPWDALDDSAHSAAGADRFVWQVSATCGESAHEARLTDPDVHGAWRDLIDAVKAETDAAR